MRNTAFRWIGAWGVIGMFALCAPGWAEPPQGAQTAVWTAKDVDFVYFGITASYSCDSLRDAVKNALIQLGARKDPQISATGCAGSPSTPSPFPGVKGKMWVLEPADPAKSGAGARSRVQARWKTVVLKLNQESTASAPGTCELVEQIKQKILPLFATRNVNFRAECVPHQLSPTGPLLRADVLVADEKPVASSLN